MLLVVVDESMAPRVANSFRVRGRPARSVAELGLRGQKDEPLLREITTLVTTPWVLLTADDKMPLTHAEVIAELSTTIATVDGREPAHFSGDEYHFEVSNRWAHAIAVQGRGTIRRYSASSSRIWTPRW